MTGLFLFLLTGAGGGSWYVWNGYIRKNKTCRHCGGWGVKERRGLLGTSTITCGKCGGNGKTLRLAARHVQGKRVRNAAPAARAARRVVSTR
jgi:DnaJ-class molecular chaperone